MIPSSKRSLSVRNAKRERANKRIIGFTLIEILIVLFIISIVTGVGLLTIGRNDNKRLQSFANELTQEISLAQEYAILQPTMLGIMIDDDSFYFATYQLSEDKKKSAWIPLNDTALKKQLIPADFRLAIQGNDNREEDEPIPRIIISTSGDITPFTLYLGKRGEKPRYALIGDANGKISYEAR